MDSLVEIAKVCRDAKKCVDREVAEVLHDAKKCADRDIAEDLIDAKNVVDMGFGVGVYEMLQFHRASGCPETCRHAGDN